MDTEQNMTKCLFKDSQDKQDMKICRQSARQLAYKKEAVKDVTEFAKRKKDEMQKLKDNFNEKWPIGLMWDSKVPDKDKWLFHFFSLKASDKCEVTQEIEKYLNLYKEIYDIENVKDANDQESISSAYDKIQNLYEELSTVEVIKRSGLHTFVVLPKRWVVERSFAWLENADDCGKIASGNSTLAYR